MAIARNMKKKLESSSAIRRMFELGAQLKEQHGENRVCDFSLGNPSLPPPEEFNRLLVDTARNPYPGKHAYMPNAGYPDVRQALAGRLSGEYGVSLSSREVIMTCGAGGGLNVVLKTILNPGDEILVSVPYFVEYDSYVDNHQGVLKEVPSLKDFNLNLEAMEAAITPRCAGVLINTPNNPAGVIYPPETLAALGRLLERKSRELGRTLYLISDEPYRKLVFDNTPQGSVLRCYDNSLVVYSYSKTLSIPGERIGWIGVNPACADKEELVNGLIIANRILGFVNAPALMQKVIGFLEQGSVEVKKYERNRDLLCGALKKMGYRFVMPRGTFYLFPEAPGGDDLKVVEALGAHLILTVPGRAFKAPGFFRIAFCVEEEVIRRSLEGFEKVISLF